MEGGTPPPFWTPDGRWEKNTRLQTPAACGGDRGKTTRLQPPDGRWGKTTRLQTPATCGGDTVGTTQLQTPLMEDGGKPPYYKHPRRVAATGGELLDYKPPLRVRRVTAIDAATRWGETILHSSESLLKRLSTSVSTSLMLQTWQLQVFSAS